jgi:hypothetical protein
MVLVSGMPPHGLVQEPQRSVFATLRSEVFASGRREHHGVTRESAQERIVHARRDPVRVRTQVSQAADEGFGGQAGFQPGERGPEAVVDA